jgi:hypothetical protein
MFLPEKERKRKEEKTETKREPIYLLVMAV